MNEVTTLSDRLLSSLRDYLAEAEGLFDVPAFVRFDAEPSEGSCLRLSCAPAEVVNNEDGSVRCCVFDVEATLVCSGASDDAPLFDERRAAIRASLNDTAAAEAAGVAWKMIYSGEVAGADGPRLTATFRCRAVRG